MNNRFKSLLLVLAVCFAASSFCVNAANGSVSAAVVANTQKHNSGLPVSPAVITKMENAEQPDEYLLAAYRPSALILDVDEELNVLSSDGETISTLDTVYQSVKRKIVLVVNVSSEAEGAAFAEYVGAKAIEDISVMSDDCSLVAKVKDLQPRIRAVVDYSAREIGKSIYDEIADIHRAGANVIVLSQAQSDYETVFYTQGMLTTVWTVVDEATEFCIAECVSTGAYGIVSSDYALCYATYEKYESGSLPRSFYNIAHRALPYSYPENSLEGIKAAVESGATHVEIDIKVTQDNELVIMHDNDLSRTTNGTGNIESMTLAQLRQYRITKNMAGAEIDEVAIPTLREVFAYLQSADFILIIEIKTEKTNCCDLLKALMDEYRVYEKSVVITFSINQLKLMRQKLPEVPLASLNSFYYADFSNGVLGDFAEVNAVPDCSFDYDVNANRNYKSRGYMAFAWTYDTARAVIGAVEKGCTGITNNRAEQIGGYEKRIYAENFSVGSGADIGSATFCATAESYDGTQKQVDTSVAFYEKTETGYRVILKYKGSDYTLYSSAVEVLEKAAVPSEPEQGDPSEPSDTDQGKQPAGGCRSSLNAGVFGLLALIGCAVIGKRARLL